MKHVALVILHYNGEKDTLTCLASIGKLLLKEISLSVIVVDNGSEERFTIQDSRVKILRNEENLGFSGGNNVGIRYALEQGAEYVVVLNNDTVVDKNLIAALLKVADSEKSIGIVSPKIYFAKGHEFHKNRYKEEEKGKIIWYAGGIMDWDNVLGSHRGVDEVDHGQYETAQQTDFATGCCMMLKKEMLQKVGLFDEDYFLYYEDADVSMRARQAGYSVMYEPSAVLWHINASSAGGSGSVLQDYFTTRNRLLFGMRYAPIRSKIALFRESIRLLLTGRIWQKRGVVDYYRRNLKKGSYTV